MLFNLLVESVADSSTSEGTTAGVPSYILWIILGVFLIGWIVMSYFTNKKRKQQAETEAQKRNAIKPGFVVTTIGGIVGTVVAVDDEKNTFVLETGSEEHLSHLKFDKLAIYTSVDPKAEEHINEENNNIIKDDETKADSEEVFLSNDTIEEKVDVGKVGGDKNLANGTTDDKVD